jgi:hypothetical protein
VYDDAGEELGTADLSLLCFPPSENVFADALGVWKAQQVPESPLLDELGVDDWENLDTWFGSGEKTWFYLNALTSRDDDVFQALYYELYNQTHHQGTFSGATGPAARLLARLLPEATRERQLTYADYFNEALGREERSLQAAHRAKSAVIAVAGADDPAEMIAEDHWMEGIYWDVVHAVSRLTPVWIEWLAGDDEELRRVGARLLAFAIDEQRDRAVQAMLDGLRDLDDRTARAELLVTMVLMDPWSDAIEAALLEQLASDDLLLRLAAAMTLVRTQTTEAPDEAIHVLVDTLGDPQPVEEDYYGLYWTGWDLSGEISFALASLGEERATEFLPRMAKLVDALDPIAALGVASAMLDIVYPSGYDGEPLNQAQRLVIETFAGSENVWKFNVNAHEVLRMNDLPADRRELRDLLG